MSLRFVIDEDTRDTALWECILKHNLSCPEQPLDVVRVGDPDGPAFSVDDPTLVRWAAQCGRIIVSHDENTLIGHHGDYVQEGHSTPGLVIVKRGSPVSDIVEWLALIAYYAEAVEYASTTHWIPE